MNTTTTLPLFNPATATPETRRHALKHIINHFERIPHERWTIGTVQDCSTKRRCAMGHTLDGALQKTALTHLVTDLLRQPNDTGWNWLAYVNNGVNADYPQSHPKDRVLSALYDKLKALL